MSVRDRSICGKVFNNDGYACLWNFYYRVIIICFFFFFFDGWGQRIDNNKGTYEKTGGHIRRPTSLTV